MHPYTTIAILFAALCFAPAATSSEPITPPHETVEPRDARAAPRPVTVAATLPRETPQRITHEFGTYLRYIPKGDIKGTVVLIHGSIGEGESAVEAAETYLKRWITFADRHHRALLAPAFDQENFGGHAGPGGGYRGLFGRHVGADAFLNAIVDDTRSALAELPERFALYGHSAGGQFVSRYLVMHPQRVAAAVISAAGTFAFPDDDVAWTNGMKPLRRRIRWSDDAPWKEIEIKPDPQNWAKAAEIPIAVVVGRRDTAPVKAIPGNPGETHVERAKAWVNAMDAYARQHGRTPRIRCIEVEKVGHNSRRLTPACQKALVDSLSRTQPCRVRCAARLQSASRIC